MGIYIDYRPRRAGKTTLAVKWVKAGRMWILPSSEKELLSEKHRISTLLAQTLPFKNDRAILVSTRNEKERLRTAHDLHPSEIMTVFEALDSRTKGKELYVDNAELVLSATFGNLAGLSISVPMSPSDIARFYGTDIDEGVRKMKFPCDWKGP
ncbi:MAG: hypothetical protein KAR06_02480 [Deltaproteobacteria bacterium]|nr:hypothetical protein [Deltaproteobacteria bacterium]